MTRKKSELRTLLFQARETTRVCREEHDSFVRYSGLSLEQIDVLNVFDRPDFKPNVVEGYDALFVGGASSATVLEPEKYPFVENGKDLLIHCIDCGLPVFASCFGFQLATIALGGEIIRDETDFEMGTIPISLTPEARDDPLFRDVSSGFRAVAVHRERTLTAPEHCVMLAYTEACCHSFRAKDKPFWCFQFHPEVDRSTLVERLTVYKTKYTENDGHLDRVLDSAQETPESNALTRTFVERVLLDESP